jgi:hypothetical protein
MENEKWRMQIETGPVAGETRIRWGLSSLARTMK